jgi:hypothetical protein
VSPGVRVDEGKRVMRKAEIYLDVHRKRGSLPVCEGCHDDIHAGRYDGPSLRSDELESRVR